MAKLRDTDLNAIFRNLKEFKYKEVVDGVEVEVTATLYPESQINAVTYLFEDKYGDLRCSGLMEKYKDGTMSAVNMANLLENILGYKWKHYLGMWKAEYNPLWNVDGTEVRTVTTQYGKITTMVNGKVETTEQLEDGVNETTHGLTQTTEQLVNGSDTTTFGKSVTDEQLTNGSDTTTFGKSVSHTQTTNSTTETEVSAFNSSSYVDKDMVTSKDGNRSDTDSGTETTSHSIGKTKSTDGGTETIEHNAGKTSVTDSGKDTTTMNSGKTQVSNSGEDINKDTGTDIVTDEYVRSGNIGVTMTQQLLTAEKDFWSHFSFFDMWYSDIAKTLSLPIYD